MTSVAPSLATSEPEVSNISTHGFRLLVDGEELFVPFSDFPWFRDASIAKLSHLERPSPNHLYWPDLDIDLSLESVRYPERFPLVAKAG